MASFDKKLDRFLDRAIKQNIIDRSTRQKLTEFQNSRAEQDAGWFNLSNALTILGALVGFAGIVMLIAANWGKFSDLTRFIGFLLALGAVHMAGLVLTHKHYEKTGHAFHIIGAGMVLAGIGLIAQIFNLHSNTGEAYLTWGLLIAPLGLVLSSGPIILMALAGMFIWTGHQFTGIGLIPFILFLGAVAYLITMISFWLNRRQISFANYLSIPGLVGLLWATFLFSFSHRLYSIGFLRKPEIPDHFFTIILALLIPALMLHLYLWFTAKGQKDLRWLYGAMGLAGITLLGLCFILYKGVDFWGITERFEFGSKSRSLNSLWTLSLLATASYFALCIFGAVRGALTNNNWLLNISMILIGIGIFARFIDLFGSLLSTGSMFLVCGAVLLAIGFGLERWRRQLKLMPYNLAVF